MIVCEKKECLQGKKEICSCEAIKSGDYLRQMIHVKEFMQNISWEFDYTTLARPEHRRLCAAGTCLCCGGCLCLSFDLDDTAFGDDLLAMAYRHLWQFNKTSRCYITYKTFRERFVDLFHEQDRAFIREWLDRPENLDVGRMYRRRHLAPEGESRLWRVPSKDEQPVFLYTIIRSGADADQGNFPSPSPEGSFFSHDLARAELTRLVEEEMKSLNKRFNKIEEDKDFWEACEDGCAAAHFSRLEVISSELVGVSRPCSPEAVTVTQFSKILDEYLPGCGRLDHFAWIAFAVSCVEEGQYVHLESSGSYERDVQEWLAGVCAALLNVQREMGTEIATGVCKVAAQSDCLYPWEMYLAAERLKERGNLDDIGELINSGEIDGYGTPIPPLSDFVDLSKYEDDR